MNCSGAAAVTAHLNIQRRSSLRATIPLCLFSRCSFCSSHPKRRPNSSLTMREKVRHDLWRWDLRRLDAENCYAVLIRGMPGETNPTRCNLAVRRSLSAEVDAAARRLRNLATFSARVRRRRISGRRLGADIEFSFVLGDFTNESLSMLAGRDYEFVPEAQL